MPALDGVRGLAILLVMVNNLYPEKPSIPFDQSVETISNTGWMGVDLFFVLSGFLITGILLDTRAGRHYFRNFYARRFLRIFPLYYGLVAVLVVLATWFAVGTWDERTRFLERQGWLWTYTVNVLMGWKGSGTAKFGTGNFWSLAVEEQFYLLWPLVVLLLSRRHLVTLAMAMIPAALALRVCWRLAERSPEAMYLLTPARMDALAVGALVAVVMRSPTAVPTFRRWARRLLPVCLGVLTALSYWRSGLSGEDLVVQTVGYSVIALMFGALVGLVVADDREPGLGDLFCHPVLRFLGRYSYGIYVFMGPVMLLLEREVPFVRALPTVSNSHVPAAVLVLVLASSISLALALLSWHGYEQHFLKLKERFPYRS